MPRIAYIEKNLRESSRAIIVQANSIIEEYEGQGFKLTLRQLYYQFVARDLIPNTMKSYKRMGSIINDGRLCGLIDWYAIEDRTRAVVSNSHWESPSEIARSAAKSYRIDKWVDQEFRPEIWIEKEALAGVVAGVCRELDISYLSCRGYTSQSEMWASSQRLLRTHDNEQTPVILHFGDHDPSGIDMTRDITDRLTTFMGGVKLQRLALNMDQVDRYGPPPNPAKMTDSRFGGYVAEFGTSSWELDALEPKVLVDLIRSTVLSMRDDDLWDAQVAKENEGRGQLSEMADDMDD